MRTWLLTFACFGGVVLTCLPVHAQRPAEGSALPTSSWKNPIAVEGEKETRWLSAYGGWIGAGPYVVADRDHAWHHEIGGVLEIVRGQDWSLLATAQSTLIADPDNSIRFNPRANFWEEGLLFAHRFEGVDVHVGYVHRCKHDIDNLALGEERALIYGSMLGRAIVPLASRPSNSYVAVETDLYMTLQDDRHPSDLEGVGPDWYRLLGAIHVDLHLRQSLPVQNMDAYFAPSGSVVAYSENRGVVNRFGAWKRARFNGGASAGLILRGRAELRIGVEYTYLSDTAIPARPRDAHLVRLAVHVLSPSMLR